MWEVHRILPCFCNNEVQQNVFHSRKKFARIGGAFHHKRSFCPRAGAYNTLMQSVSRCSISSLPILQGCCGRLRWRDDTTEEEARWIWYISVKGEWNRRRFSTTPLGTLNRLPVSVNDQPISRFKWWGDWICRCALCMELKDHRIKGPSISGSLAVPGPLWLLPFCSQCKSSHSMLNQDLHRTVCEECRCS